MEQIPTNQPPHGSQKNPEEDHSGAMRSSTDEDSHKVFSFGAAKKEVVNEETGETTTVDASHLSNIELIKMAEQFTEQLELEKAVALYDEGLKKYPNDTVILD